MEGVKKYQNVADILYGRPLTLLPGRQMTGPAFDVFVVVGLVVVVVVEIVVVVVVGGARSPPQLPDSPPLFAAA